jgi:hypothetical protein
VLMDVDFIVEQVYVGDAHVLQSYHFNREALPLLIVADAAVDATAETTADHVLEVETVSADALLAFGRGLGVRVGVQDGLFGVAGFHVERAVGAAQLVGLGGGGEGDGDGHAASIVNGISKL